jgi:hypothetical protein
MEKVIKWLEYDYLPRVGAYRKDCKQGCDACMPMHDSDDYCDIDMLCKILALLKEQEAVARCMDCQFHYEGENEVDAWDRCRLHSINTDFDNYCSWAVRKGEHDETGGTRGD